MTPTLSDGDVDCQIATECDFPTTKMNYIEVVYIGQILSRRFYSIRFRFVDISKHFY